MPTSPTYPGVYIEEIPSGVRTITGVSTSVAAFIGTARRGPIDDAVRVQSFADFERRFGGLDADSEMSYAVRQFFLNGGTEGWVVRLAKNAIAATKTYQDGTLANVVAITALEKGLSGNGIAVQIDYATANPASTFNLLLTFTDPANSADTSSEVFQNLSMNSQDGRYIEDVVNDISELVSVERVVTDPTLNALAAATSRSGELDDASGVLLDVATLVDATHNRLRISVNGSSPVDVQFNVPTDVSGTSEAARLVTLCAAIQTQVTNQANGNMALAGFTCAPDAVGNGILMTSGAGGENSTVRALPGLSNDASARLELGAAGGGTETDGVAVIRPAETPPHGTFTSDTITGAGFPNTLPDAGNHQFQISLDGYGPDEVDVGTGVAPGASLGDRLEDVASRIQTAVRALKPANPAYGDFACITESGPRRLILSSGSRGAGSSVTVTVATSNDLADDLNLLAGTAVPGVPDTLENGDESPFTDAEAYNIYIGSRAAREGLFALEEVDLFNILCLPGISDSGILADAVAYCEEQRAFLIVDAPQVSDKPSEMEGVIGGTTLPKSKNAAVYYPWINIADPLKGGKQRETAPCGTVAGLYSRTDATRGVWKAPAGTDATLSGVQGVAYKLTDSENGTLNPLGVNCIRIFPVFGAVSWGARTLRGADQMASEWKYVPVRRLALFIEESLFRGTKWVVFEPNDEPLWAQIRLNLGAFMHNLFRKGAFQGMTPKDAYFVKCDSETTTQNDIDLGIVNIVVGFAPLKPAEFVIIKIQQIAGQLET